MSNRERDWKNQRKKGEKKWKHTESSFAHSRCIDFSLFFYLLIFTIHIQYPGMVQDCSFPFRKKNIIKMRWLKNGKVLCFHFLAVSDRFFVYVFLLPLYAALLSFFFCSCIFKNQGCAERLRFFHSNRAVLWK